MLNRQASVRSLCLSNENRKNYLHSHLYFDMEGNAAECVVS